MSTDNVLRTKEDILRFVGYSVATRPKDGPATWCMGNRGPEVPEPEAYKIAVMKLERAEQEAKERQAEAAADVVPFAKAVPTNQKPPSRY